MRATKRLAALGVALAVLVQGCASVGNGPGRLEIDTSISARSQGSRVRFIVLHYTVSNKERALELLSRGEVSSHYLVTDDDPPRVYRLVDEDRAAWHAGQSEWQGYTWLNRTSIGIEIVNRGPIGTAPDGTTQWQPYKPTQIEVVKQLVRDIARRHDIAPENIVGHSDVAPLRKQDPGPMFPWRELARAGIGRWYDETAAQAMRERFEAQGLPDIAWAQLQLARLGYGVPRTGIWDAETRAVLAAFQMHYRPSRYDGVFDAETAGILAALVAASGGGAAAPGG
ncbi:N-acetylmuramoyl-L-alanine amidase [Pigmentiphaga sp.]|uniref:peptidoglycan recognition protein family protein n=1 Tax=Pigmentiphaga sp. TaxID=1977564 RepID=UPI0025EF2BD7|nr:N-acetylmuramoyl-L-alanine amidase [Pigmentiphaga sp.]MBX6317110.1 N-acetylmuramoyl-L-alanine amidase [Pigmentiphaga sp.]